MKAFPTAPLRNLVSQVSTWNPLKPGNEDEVFDYIDLSAIDQELKAITGARTVQCAEAPSRARQLVHAGDVLVSTVRPNLNGVAMVPPQLDGATASTGFCVIRAARAALEPSYVFHWVRSPTFVSRMVAQATGASYPAVSDRIVLDSEIPLPPLHEQHRIAAILDKADALRTKRREALAQLDRLAQSTFVEMFGNPDEHIRAGATKLLSEVVAPERSVTYGIVQAGPEVPDGVPYIKTGDIRNGRILEERLSRTSPAIAADYSRSAVSTGDIVISIRATVGTTAVVPPSLDGANLTQGTARISPGDSVRTAYLLSYLRTEAVQRWIQTQVKGATFREITLGRLRELPVHVPKLPQQDKFVGCMNALVALESRNTASLVELDALFASLQQRAFRGAL